jgi:hypothetical protein
MNNLESRLEKAKKGLKKLQADVEKENDFRMSMAEISKNKEYEKERALLNKLKVATAAVERLEANLHNKKQKPVRTRRVKGGLKKTRRKSINGKIRSSS